MKKPFLTICMLLLGAVSLLSCKKDNADNPSGFKDGEEVELLVDHRFASENDVLLTLPKSTPTYLWLDGFQDREPGYNYRVKARFYREKEVIMDAPSYYFKFVKVISKTQTKETGSFKIQIIQSPIPSGPHIQLFMRDGNYYFKNGSVQVTAADDIVRNQLKEIYEHAEAIRANGPPTIKLKWTTIEATVIHDPLKFGKAYQVQSFKFTP